MINVECMISFEMKFKLKPHEIVQLDWSKCNIEQLPFGVNERMMYVRSFGVVVDDELFFRSRPRLQLERTILPIERKVLDIDVTIASKYIGKHPQNTAVVFYIDQVVVSLCRIGHISTIKQHYV